MDYIFESNSSAFVFGKPAMTQRHRPAAFSEAEIRRVDAGQNNEAALTTLEKAGAANRISAHVESLERDDPARSG